MSGDYRTNARKIARTSMQNIDNGSGTTQDEILMVSSHKIVPKAARIIYEDATTGTCAAATYSIGITVGGAEIVAATALENSKTVGTYTALTLTATYTDANPIPANTMISTRYTGVATTVAGMCHIEFEYEIAAI